ncbi:MAG: hypothetical protein MK132_25155 [Lentisphaerales bacterium]|nr:hypothetical protein [Lentisphaerales bacterium]
MYRRTAPKVRNGKVLKKNNWQQSPNMFYTRHNEILVEKERAGKGYKHLIRKQEVYDMFKIIPEWKKLAYGLDGIVLGQGSKHSLGYYNWSVITLHAWETEIIWDNVSESFIEEHQYIFDMLGITYGASHEKGYYRVEFAEDSAKAFSLIHVFLHELGHHVDKMTSKRRMYCGRGEAFAEAWANERLAEVYRNYCKFYRL